jgi:predicted metal-dependent phosphoesterase TrpH
MWRKMIDTLTNDLKFDLHIHSKHSYDSFLNPEKIIKIAKRNGLDGIAITDHNTIKGGIEALKVNDEEEFQVIVGAEIKTEYDDIIGLFLNEEIRTRRFEEVIEEIKSNGGLSVLPHPYRKYKFPEEIVDKVDIVEAFNSRSKKEGNEMAYELAKKFKKPMTAGSDAHLGFEIGRGRTIVNSEVKEALKNGETEIEGKESNYYLAHGLSVAMEKIKRVM